MTAHIQQSGLIRLKTRYFKAVRAGWRAARAGWKAASEQYSQQYHEHDRSTTADSSHNNAGSIFSRYLKSHDGHSPLRSLNSLNSVMMQHEQIETYERELLTALNPEERPVTRNIAISGAMGTGKSAFIQAFTARNPQFKYTRFFLPAQPTINARIAPGRHENENVLLEQLLCNITDNIPDDIKPPQPQPGGWRKVIPVVMALLTSYSIATLGYLSGSLGMDQSTVVKALHRHLSDPMLAFAKKYAPLLAELSLFLLATLLILYLFSGIQKLLAGQKSRPIPPDSRADLSDSGNYLHQITHAFTCSRHDVVIVENLTDPSQLETLYRVNGYLNGSGHIKHPIYFIYVLTDDTLTARDRTRFFDLIIPVIPASNADNVGPEAVPELYKQLKTIHSGGQDAADAMEKNLIAPSWTNILHIFQSSSLNPLLLKSIAIPENTEKLAVHALPDNQDTFNLLLTLIHTREIHDATLNRLLCAFPDFYLEHLNLEYIHPGRIEIISQHPKCRFSLKSLEWLAKHENHLKADTTVHYLLRFWHEYKASAVSTAQLTVNTIVKLLSSSKIRIDDQLWLCNLLNEENEIDSRILTAMLSPITSQPAEHFAMKIGFHRLETLMATARTLSEKIHLLSQQVKYLSRREVLTLLSRLDIEGTGLVMTENDQFPLSSTRENIESIVALQRAYHTETMMEKRVR